MKTKILLSLILIFLFFFSLCFDRIVFYLFTTVVSIICLRELVYIRSRNNIPIAVEFMLYFLLFFFTMNNYSGALNNFVIDYKLLSLILLANLVPLVIINNKKKYNLIDALYITGATIFIGVSFNLLNQFRSYNPNYLSYIFVVAFTNKIFAIIADVLVGQTKLLPTIIPKRTMEGAFWGMVLGSILSAMFYISIMTTKLPIYGIIFVSFILSMISQLGEFVFAFMKKEFNKDNFSSHFIKNSGILDLIDSIIFVTLGFILFVSIV